MDKTVAFRLFILDTKNISFQDYFFSPFSSLSLSFLLCDVIDIGVGRKIRFVDN